MKINRLIGLVLVCTAMIFTSCDDCRKIECLNDGECDEGVCDCPEGFSGDLCEFEDLCITDDVECGANGECQDGTCVCRGNYYGEVCSDYCLEGTYDNGNCDCFQGYEGPSCDTLSRDKYIGVYTVISTMSNGNKLSNITEGDWTTQEKWKVTLPNLAFDGDTDGWGEVEGDMITFPDQKVNGINSDTFGYNISMIEAGTIVDDGEEITFTLKVSRAVDSVDAPVVTGTHTFTRPSPVK